MAQARNTNVGRRFMGSPIAKSGTKPPARTGSASGYFVGTGVNRKTAARAEMQPSRSSPAQNYTRQAEQFMRQAPEPFRNPAGGANLAGKGGIPSDRRQGNPGNPKGGRVMSQAEMNRATGHAANYKPKGYHAATSGFPSQGARRVGSSHDALKSGWQSRQSTPGAKLMGGASIARGFGDRGLVQGPGIPTRLLPSRARKGSIPQG